MTIMMIFII